MTDDAGPNPAQFPAANGLGAGIHPNFRQTSYTLPK